MNVSLNVLATNLKFKYLFCLIDDQKCLSIFVNEVI